MHSSNLRHYPDDALSCDGVVIKRAQLAESVRARDLTREAQRRAKALVREAQREAQVCWQQAACEGYEAGFRLVVEQVIDYFARCRERQQVLREQVLEQVRQSLQAFLGEPELMLRLAEELATSHGAKTEPMRVWLPQRAKRMAPAVRKQLIERFPTVEVACSDTPSLIVEWGEKVMEFSPPDIAHELTGAALAACADACRAIDDDMLGRQVMEEALRPCDDAGTPPSASFTTEEENTHG